MSSLKKVTQKGFTIVELLIVIVVIGILAALVITTYNGIQQKGRNTERQTDLKALQGQLEAYYAQNGRYPTSGAQASATLGLGSTSADNVTFIGAQMKGLDREALRDPKGTAGSYAVAASASGLSNQYAYVASPAGCDNSATDCTGYVLTANQEGATALTVNSNN
jgi:type II secretion system protein G